MMCSETNGANLSDFSHFTNRRVIPNVDFSSPYRLNPYMEQEISSIHGYPTMTSPLISNARDYLQQDSMVHQRNFLDIHNSLHSGANTASEMASGLNEFQVGSPKPGIRRHERKRTLSSSPYSDFDINSMIRSSPSSLVSCIDGFRSSNASGSYGHISADTAMEVSPLAVLNRFHQLHHFMRQGLTSPYLLPPQQTLSQQPVFPTHLTAPLSTLVKDPFLENNPTNKGTSACQGYSKQRTTETTCIKNTRDIVGNEDKDNTGDWKKEPSDFVETNCHWTDCEREFPSQDDLVKHICQDHIHSNNKAFICRWKDCSRGEKPFTRQYTLVMHMRGHTGEKPYKCSFEGCSKVCSRLDTLKTHLISHTGDKPYLCQFIGCTKAFSTGSDRAKHLNWTHYKEKPYVCKAQGCTKRYTDRRPLRRHVKTTHGPQFYAKKKHKDDSSGNTGVAKDKDSPTTKGKTESQRADKAVIVNTEAKSQGISNPEPYSKESAKNSCLTSDESGLVSKIVDKMAEVPIRDNCVSTISALGEVTESDALLWDVNPVIDLEDEGYFLTVHPISSNDKENHEFVAERKSNPFKVLRTKTSWLPKLQFPKSNGSFENQTAITQTGIRRRQNSTSSASTFYCSMASDVSCQSQYGKGISYQFSGDTEYAEYTIPW